MSWEKLLILSEFYHVTINYILGETDEMGGTGRVERREADWWLAKAIADRINELRGELSLEMLSDAADLNLDTIRKLVTAQIYCPTSDTILKVCSALKITIDEFFHTAAFHRETWK